MSRSEPVPEKLMAYLDGEMSEQEAREFRELLRQHPEWREEVAEMAAVVQATDKLAFKAPPAEVWDGYWQEIDSRIGKRTGWVFLAIGGAVLFAFGVGKVLFLSENMYVRLGLVFVILGLTTLFVSVIRGHLLEKPKDRYRRIRK